MCKSTPNVPPPVPSSNLIEDDWARSPNNPRNWSNLIKWVSASIVSLYTFVSPFASSTMSPGLPEIGVKYHIGDTLDAMTVSIFVLAFAFGPLVLAPLSETYGRVWVLHIANLLTLCFSLGCALAPNAASLIGFRFIAGIAGSAPIAIGGGCVSDLWSERERGTAMALFTLGPLFGPVLGPVLGGFIVEKAGIQYVFYLIVGLSGLAGIIGLPLLRETYAPVIRLRLYGHNSDPEKGMVTPNRSLRYFCTNLYRPIELLCRSFICFILSAYTAVVYGIYYLMFTTFPVVFSEVYGFGVGVSGLVYLGTGVGFTIAALFGVRIGDFLYSRLADRNGGRGTPEMRIPCLIFGSLFAPIGLFWYGWSAEAKIHWIMPIVGTGTFGFSLFISLLPIQLYLIDTFKYASSALVAASLFRSLFAFAFPLFGRQMFAALGYGPGNSLLAGVSIVLGIPFPIWIYYHGERIRLRSPLSC